MQCVETKVIFLSTREAGRQYQIAPSHIADCARGGRKTAGGYHWEYISGGL